MARSHPRIAILGAGPVGLEAAILARKLGFPVTIYERGRVGENLERWGFVRLFSPFGMNSTFLGKAVIRSEHPGHLLPSDGDQLTGREHVAAYLSPLATTGLIGECIKNDATVIAVSRAGLMKSDGVNRSAAPFRLLLRDSKGNESHAEAEVVLDCTGVYPKGRNLGDGGLPAVGEAANRSQIAGGLEDVLGGQKAKYSGKTVLLIGAGYTAATHIEMLSKLAETNPETWVVWLARGPRSQPLPRHPNDPLKERDRLAARANMLATRGEGNIEFHPSTTVERIVAIAPDKGFTVTARVAGQLRTWEVDRIIASVGYRPDRSLYQELQVQECPGTEGPIGVAAALAKQSGDDCLTAVSCGPAGLKTTEPNFFILGSKSYGRNSHFLLKAGFEQVRDVFTLLTGKPVPERL